MKFIHIECNPDAYLARQIGFTRKNITHHQGKSRVFNALKNNKNHFALVDEDPGSIQHPYQAELMLIKDESGLKLFKDKSGNRVVVINPKLEDWIISISRELNINVRSYGLPENPDELHEQINQKLNQFEHLLNDLIKRKNSPLKLLQKWLSVTK